MAAIDVAGVGFSYHAGLPVLRNASLAVPPGAFLGIVGPNGAGKSTLLHLMSGALAPSAGSVLLDGRPLRDWKRRDIARKIAVVPQSEPHAFPYRVSEIVLMGRTPHLTGLLSTETPADHAAARRAALAPDPALDEAPELGTRRYSISRRARDLAREAFGARPAFLRRLPRCYLGDLEQLGLGDVLAEPRGSCSGTAIVDFLLNVAGRFEGVAADRFEKQRT